MKTLRLLLPVSLLITGVCSAATIIATAPTPSNTDLFNNATIINSSPLYAGGSSAANMFGQTGGVEANNTLFADGQPAGTAFSVTFDIGAPQIIGGIELYVADDSGPLAPSNARGIVRFQLLQGATVISDVTVLAPGQNNFGVYGGNNLKITDSFSPVTGSQFTAIFYSNDNATFGGSRILELDAVQGVIPEPGTLSMLTLGGLAVLFARRRKA